MREKLLTINELAEQLQKSPAQIYNMISQGRESEELPRSIKIGRCRRWPESELEAWIKRQLEVACGSHSNTSATTAKKTINRI